jgi:hypothetical protein
MKFTDIIIPKSWFKKNCSPITPGSKSLTCWLKTLLNNLPTFASDEEALAAGVTIYINTTTGGVTIVGFQTTPEEECDFSEIFTLVFVDGEETTQVVFVFDSELGGYVSDQGLIIVFNEEGGVWQLLIEQTEDDPILLATATAINGTWAIVGETEVETITFECGGEVITPEPI